MVPVTFKTLSVLPDPPVDTSGFSLHGGPEATADDLAVSLERLTRLLRSITGVLSGGLMLLMLAVVWSLLIGVAVKLLWWMFG